YPSLLIITEILRGKKANISRSDLNKDELQEIILELNSIELNDSCIDICKKYMEPKSTVKDSEIISHILVTLYKVGAIGIKLSSLDTFIWSYIDQPSITIGEGKRALSIKVHKMLHRALDISLSQNEIYSNEDYV
ncbi:MAG: P-loop ATPase, Sll1717 family, partial [Acinetobacter tandoii]